VAPQFQRAVIASVSEAIHAATKKVRVDCFCRGACHRARIRATRWLLAMTSNTSRRSRGAMHPSFAWNVRPSATRAQGMPGARCARSRTCRVVNTCVSHHGHTGTTRHSPRNGLRLIRTLPGDRASCHRHLWRLLHKLDASVEASGPHDFAVRFMCRSSMAPSASTASRRTSVTIAKRPSDEAGRWRICR
jgi:hypothetical protein